VGKANERFSSRREYLLKSVTIIGQNGQLGADLVKTFTIAGWEVKPLSHQAIQVEDIDSVSNALRANQSDWIINTAAFHKVDACEMDPEKAWQINAGGQFNVATLARDLNMKSVYISSDYVFSGEKVTGSTYSEADLVSPINSYGNSKAAGEYVTLASNPENLVVRIASVFGAMGSSGKGGNFIETILEKARNSEPLLVVDDISMSPTYTVDASERILKAMDESLYGVVHASNSGFTTWFDFAKEILKLTGAVSDLNLGTTNWEQTPRRPRNSALNTDVLDTLCGQSVSWKDGLKSYLVEKGYIA